jgi:simple sugar transport system ATP-binding protein
MSLASPNAPVVEVIDIVKRFGPVIALSGVSMRVSAGEVMCLLGDNGAGKSTLIKTLAGVHKPTSGEYLVDGEPVSFANPRDALAFGIATVFQDLAMVPLMSITRNFFMGREPTRGFPPFRVIDFAQCAAVAREEMRKICIRVRDPDQAVGTLSGGERQCLAIARATYFGARVLILDEPTSALGVGQTGMVLKYIDYVRTTGAAVIFISHNARHAHAIGDAFTILNRGRTVGSYRRGEVNLEELQSLMSDGREIRALSGEFPLL